MFLKETYTSPLTMKVSHHGILDALLDIFCNLLISILILGDLFLSSISNLALIELGFAFLLLHFRQNLNYVSYTTICTCLYKIQSFASGASTTLMKKINLKINIKKKVSQISQKNVI